MDWGDARIGVAACDAAGILAFPVATVPAGPDAVSKLLAIIEEYRPIEIVIGLPRSLSGGEGPAAGRIRLAAAAFAAELVASGHPLPVRLVDERLTTVEAARRLRSAGRTAKSQRSVIDSAAAAGILEHALNVEGAGGTPPGELVSPAERPPADQLPTTAPPERGDRARDVDAGPGGRTDPGQGDRPQG